MTPVQYSINGLMRASFLTLTFDTNKGTLRGQRVYKVFCCLRDCARAALQTVLYMSFLGMRRAEVG